MSSPHVSLPDPVVDEAINWLVRLEISESQVQERLEFEQWLQQSPQHQQAWERVKGIRGSFISLPSKPLQQTLDTLERHSEQSRISRRNMLKLLSVSGLLISGSWITKQHTPWQRLLADYSTETGQQQHFTLPDGSELMLNTDSALSTDYSGPAPKLNLRRGEMFLNMSSDAAYTSKPLLIKTPVGRITTTASRLLVRLDKSRARVSVQTGQVELLSRQGMTQTAVSGDSFWLSDSGLTPALSVIPPDAWVSGAISGNNIPLGALLDELSRYRLGIIEYPSELNDLPVSGIFHLKNTDQTLHFLAQVQPVKVEFRTAYWVVVSPA